MSEKKQRTYQIWQEVHEEHPREGVSFAQRVQHVADNGEADVRHDDTKTLTRLEAHGVRIEMVGPTRLLLAGDVCEQMHGPAEETVKEDVYYPTMMRCLGSSEEIGVAWKTFKVPKCLRIFTELATFVGASRFTNHRIPVISVICFLLLRVHKKMLSIISVANEMDMRAPPVYNLSISSCRNIMNYQEIRKTCIMKTFL